MAQWDFARSLAGAGEKLETLQAGAGGWTKGDPLVSDGSGKWIKNTAASGKPKFVANCTIAANAYGEAVPCLPTNVFRVKLGNGSATVGGQYDLDPTTDINSVNAAGTTTKGIEVIAIDEANTSMLYVVSRGWLA